jgi:hypothetical protein
VGLAVVKLKEAACALTLDTRHSMVAEPKIKPKRGAKFIAVSNLRLQARRRNVNTEAARFGGCGDFRTVCSAFFSRSAPSLLLP